MLKVKGQIQGRNTHGCQADLEAGVSIRPTLKSQRVQMRGSGQDAKQGDRGMAL